LQIGREGRPRRGPRRKRGEMKKKRKERREGGTTGVQRFRKKATEEGIDKKNEKVKPAQEQHGVEKRGERNVFLRPKTGIKTTVRHEWQTAHKVTGEGKEKPQYQRKRR